MPKLKTIQERWEDFAAKTLPKGAPDIQYREMRTAFFSGFYCCLVASRDEVAQMPNDDDDEAACRELEAWHDEAQAYFLKIIKDYIDKN